MEIKIKARQLVYNFYIMLTGGLKVFVSLLKTFQDQIKENKEEVYDRKSPNL